MLLLKIKNKCPDKKYVGSLMNIVRSCHQLKQLSLLHKRNEQLKVYQNIPFCGQTVTESEICSRYALLKKKVYEKQINSNEEPQNDVFANNEVSFRDINFFGFNFNYTLASYSDDLHDVIYKLSVEKLIEEKSYPCELSKLKYDSSFTIRGLHFDVKNGYMMKLNSMSRVQLGSVYKGYQRVDDFEVLDEYGGTLVDVGLVGMQEENDYSARVYQRVSAFSMAFLSLLTNVIDYFVEKNIEFNPAHVYRDINNMIEEVGESKEVYQIIIENMDVYLPQKKGLESYLNTLIDNKKELFLLTNRSFDFVNRGMTHLFNNDWRDLFEVVIVNARKPDFFGARESKPFRNIDLTNGAFCWTHVKQFQRHGVYGEGNVNLFTKLTNYEGSKVIYFGSEISKDVLSPVERIGWRSGVIIPELANEINIGNSPCVTRDIEWLVSLEHLIPVLQRVRNASNETCKELDEWKIERKSVQARLKNAFNPYFGSMFRTHHTPTAFCSRINQYADLYMSSIENLANYSHDFHFLPSRNLLPHERI